MVVCKFYQSGRCRYGNNCKFEHIDPPGGFGNGKDPFSTPTKSSNRFGGSKAIEEQPQWPLSVIGNKDNAEQGNELTGDLSPEELRVLAYSMAPRGMSAEVTQRESQLVAEHQAKVDALSRGGMQTSPPNTANDNFRPKDPFNQNLSTGSHGNPGFGGGFGGGNVNGGAQQQVFGQAPQQAQSSNPFGSGASQGGGNPFGQNQTFGQSGPQPPVQIQSPLPPSNPANDSQFSATQFGFAKVPEAAPPPQFY